MLSVPVRVGDETASAPVYRVLEIELRGRPIAVVQEVCDTVAFADHRAQEQPFWWWHAGPAASIAALGVSERLFAALSQPVWLWHGPPKSACGRSGRDNLLV